jgi:hypothetical protein
MSEFILDLAAVFPVAVIIFCTCHYIGIKISQKRQRKYNGIIKSMHKTNGGLI